MALRAQVPRHAAVLLALAAACSGDDAVGPAAPDLTPAAMVITSGNEQVGLVGAPLGRAIVVRVTNGIGDGVPDVAVAWTVRDGGGALSASSSTTDPQGLASVTWTLGTSAGAGTNRVTASVAALPEGIVEFSAGATPGPPATVVIVSGDAQTGTVGEELTAPIVVRVEDEYGNATKDVLVAWTETGSGSFPSASAQADSLGQAATRWTLGPGAGANANTATATVAGVPTAARFTASANPGPAALLTLVSGDVQNGTVGQLLADPLVVLVTDAFENPVSGAPIVWDVVSGGGSLEAAATTSDAAGRAAATLTLGPAAGSDNHLVQVYNAELPGSPVTFRASASAAPAASLSILSGDEQEASVGRTLGEPLVVSLQDAYGNPVPGMSVNWVVTSGGGALSAFANATDTQGRAAVTWTLGMTAGIDAQQVQAFVNELSGSPVTFRASGSTGAAPTIAKVFGDAQTGPVSQPLAQPLVVLVTDAGDTPIAGVPIQWTVTAGNGALSATTTTTDVTGRASVTWTLGPAAGTDNNVVQATAAGLNGSPITFTASASDAPATATTLVLVAGNGQTGTVNEALSQLLVVQVQDGSGNPFAGTTVAWNVTAGGGSVSSTASTTDAQGNASVMWTLGPTVGTNQVEATSAGLAGSPLVFTATGTVVPPQGITLALASGDGQSGTVAQALTDQLVVVATDQAGNPVPDITVTWSITSGNGGLSAATVTTDAQGLAAVSWTLGTAAGANTNLVQAMLGGAGAPVVFAATAVADVPANVTIVSGDNQTGTVAQPLPNALVLAVSDQFGNPAGGASVTWSVTTGGGTLSQDTTVTDAQGQGSVALALGTVAGTGNHGVQATVTGLSGVFVDFTASALAGPATSIVATGGDLQTATAGSTLPLSYAVRVTDGYDNPVANATVSWTIGSGGGSVSASVTASNASGNATTQRTLGTTTGTQTTTASVPGVTPVIFTATATPSLGAAITGTISVVEQFLAPPAATAVSDATAFSVSPAPRTKSVTRRTAASLRATDPRSQLVRPRFTPDELIVTFHPAAVSAPSAGSLAFRQAGTAESVGTNIETELDRTLDPADVVVRGVSPSILAARISVTNPADLDAVAARLRSDPAVADVHRNALVYSDAWNPVPAHRAPRTARPPTTLPGDPLYAEQSWHLNMIDLPEAWDITTGSASVLVAVIDDGIRFDHPAIAPNLTSDGYDFVSDVAINSCAGGTISNTGDADEYDPDPTQPDHRLINTTFWCAAGSAPSGNHGLHVAGTIGAVGNDGLGTTGVNWNVSIRPIRVLGIAGVGTAYDAAQGVLYAAGLPADDGAGGVVQAPTGARVINMSLGGPDPAVELENAIIAATNAGALVVASAGNLASATASYPAAYAQTLAVSAVGPDGLLASYSSFGPVIDIAGPGGDLLDGGATFGVMSTAWNYITQSPIYDNAIWDGTSMAAPHVTGVAALLLAQGPSLSVTQLRARLTDYAVDLGSPGRDDLYGAGLVNARNSLTQSFSPPTQLYAQLYDALSGEVLQTAAVQPDGTYSFANLPDGFYHAFAGLDENGDQRLGVPGRRWGGFGGTATPTRVPITGGADATVSFTIGLPGELEPNDDVPSANVLPVGGYLFGTTWTSLDIDLVTIEIPVTGQYTFETSGWIGACGFALEEDTILSLYDALGNLIVSNDDIDLGALNACSRITTTLNPGTYFVGVEGYFGGRYRLAARSGP